MPAIEDHGVSDDAAEVRVAGLRDRCGRPPLVVGFVEADLHEFVFEQRRADGRDHAGRDPGASHLDHRPPGLRERAEKAPLAAIERGSGRHRR